MAVPHRLRLKELDIGQAFKLVVCPYTKDAKKDLLLITNNRFELLHIDLHTQQLRVLDKSEHQHISGVSWSPDGQVVCLCFFHYTGHPVRLKFASWRRGKRGSSPKLNSTTYHLFGTHREGICIF